jgi:hypothetical protein
MADARFGEVIRFFIRPFNPAVFGMEKRKEVSVERSPLLWQTRID